MRDFQLPGRSGIYARGGAAATSHPLATETAIRILREGGNAVDAAIAASAVLCVAEPGMTGIGGDCFAIIAEPNGRLHGLNGSGRSGTHARPEWFAERGLGAVDPSSAQAVTVPGAIDAWARLLRDHGTMGLDRVLAPAIDLAEKGVPVAPRVAFDWARVAARLADDPGSRRHLLPNGRPPQTGDIFRHPALGATMRRIAEGGPEAFYRGEIGEEIVATLRARGGFIEMDDLAAVGADPVDPVTTTYRGVTVAELPPNGQGVTALLLLNILEALGPAPADALGAERLHREIEAARLAYSYRDAVVADPAGGAVWKKMLDKGLAAELAAKIDPDRRMGPLPAPVLPQGSDTIYLTVVDENRLAVSFINSLFQAFGTGITTPNGGVTLQNRGSGFRVIPGHPNCIAPRKRPLHTIIPAMALRDGKPWISFGVMGGAYQSCGHAHFLTNVVDHGMDVQAAIDAPRVFWDETGRIMLERGLGAEVLQAMEAKGHPVGRPETPWGGGQAIRIHDNGVLEAGSDPRKDGSALGY